MLRFVCLVALAVAVHASVMDVHFSLPEAGVQTPSTMSVDITLTNPLNVPIQILNRYSPLIFDRKDTYLVEDLTTNADVEYAGRVVKYGPVEDNFGVINFAPLESITFPVNFASAYRFEENHIYRVTLDLEVFVSALQGSKHIDIHFAPTTFTFTSEQSAPKEVTSDHSSSKADQVSFTNCDSTQQSEFINTVLPNSHKMLQNSMGYLVNNCTDYYVTWFGLRDSKDSRYNTVHNNTDAIEKALSNSFKLYCKPSGCSPGVYAYVYPRDKTHEINVCAVYFRSSQDVYKTDSQPGTIIHECSHFNDVAGTNDVQYGQSGVKDLAKSNPDKAITNADSYEYFNENDARC